MLCACEESSEATRSVCTVWRWNTVPLSGRRHRRRPRRSGELLAAHSPEWTFADRGIFHITRDVRPFKATLIADIRGARRRAANEN